MKTTFAIFNQIDTQWQHVCHNRFDMRNERTEIDTDQSTPFLGDRWPN